MYARSMPQPDRSRKDVWKQYISEAKALQVQHYKYYGLPEADLMTAMTRSIGQATYVRSYREMLILRGALEERYGPPLWWMSIPKLPDPNATEVPLPRGYVAPNRKEREAMLREKEKQERMHSTLDAKARDRKLAEEDAKKISRQAMQDKALEKRARKTRKR